MQTFPTSLIENNMLTGRLALIESDVTQNQILNNNEKYFLGQFSELAARWEIFAEGLKVLEKF